MLGIKSSIVQIMDEKKMKVIENDLNSLFSPNQAKPKF